MVDNIVPPMAPSDRVGENYSLKFSSAHKWYYYPEMTKDECLVFKVYDKQARVAPPPGRLCSLPAAA